MMSNQAHPQKQLKPVEYDCQLYRYESPNLSEQSVVNGLTLIEMMGEL